MPVTKCKVVPSGLTGSLSLKQGRTAGNVTVRYLITTDNFQAMPLEIIVESQALASPANDPLPRTRDGYNIRGEADVSIFCQNVTVTQKPDSQSNQTGQWDATALFDIPEAGQSLEHMVADPFARPPVTWFETEPVTVQVAEAICEQAINSLAGQDIAVGDRVPVVNAALQPYEDGLQVTNDLMVLAAERAYATLEEMIAQYRKFTNTLNKDTFLGAPPKTAAYRGLTCRPQFTEAGIKYFSGVERVAFAVNTGTEEEDDTFRNPFIHTIVNQGFRFLDLDLPGLVDVEGAEPVLLEPDGTLLGANIAGNFTKWRTDELVDYTGGIIVA